MNFGGLGVVFISLPVPGVGVWGYFRFGFRGASMVVFGSTIPIQGHLGDFRVSRSL